MASGVGNANFNTWAVLTSANALQSRNLFGDKVDQVLAEINNGSPASTSWTLADHLGSVRDVIANNGSVNDSIAYDSYGNVLPGETVPTARGMYAWTGRQLDLETGLQYNRARWYDSGTGRWITQDPMGFDAGDSNLYRYVNNRPTVASDPSGFQVAGIDIGIVPTAVIAVLTRQPVRPANIEGGSKAAGRPYRGE